MLKKILPFVAVCSCIAAQSESIYPTMSEASLLFSPDSLSATNMAMYGNCAYRDFNAAIQTGSDEIAMGAMEHFLICSITSLVVCVSTNGVYVDSVAPYLLQDRGVGFWWLSEAFRVFKTNTVDCLGLASYIGRLHTVDYPSELVHRKVSVTLLSTNSAEIARLNAALDNYYSRREEQLRVFVDNEAVLDYRKHLFRICNLAVVGCRGMLSDAEFAAFTNQLVTVSGADEEERAVLFKGLDSE